METTLLKGLAVLEVLAASAQARGVSELADQLGWTKSNVHRVLQTLAHAGYVSKDSATARYSCTLKLWELGELVAERLDIRATARPYMHRLAADSGESVHLSILDGWEVLYIDKVESAQPVRSYTRIGGRAPAHCVATGKALLAFAADDPFRLGPVELERHTARTIADPALLAEELQRIRDAGYADNLGEWREEVHGLAAPILHGRGRAVAAIGVSGPADRLSVRRMRDVAPLVCAAAAEIARDLGLAGGVAAIAQR